MPLWRADPSSVSGTMRNYISWFPTILGLPQSFIHTGLPLIVMLLFKALLAAMGITLQIKYGEIQQCWMNWLPKHPPPPIVNSIAPLVWNSKTDKWIYPSSLYHKNGNWIHSHIKVQTSLCCENFTTYCFGPNPKNVDTTDAKMPKKFSRLLILAVLSTMSTPPSNLKLRIGLSLFTNYPDRYFLKKSQVNPTSLKYWIHGRSKTLKRPKSKGRIRSILHPITNPFWRSHQIRWMDNALVDKECLKWTFFPYYQLLPRSVHRPLVYGETLRFYYQLNQFRLGHMMMQLSTHHSTWRGFAPAAV